MQHMKKVGFFVGKTQNHTVMDKRWIVALNRTLTNTVAQIQNELQIIIYTGIKMSQRIMSLYRSIRAKEAFAGCYSLLYNSLL